jgi:hypothetical protein
MTWRRQALPPVEVTFEGDSDAALDHIHLKAAMDGIFLKGTKVRDKTTRVGRFRDDVGWRGGFGGRYRFCNGVARFYRLRISESVPYDDARSRILALFVELHMKSLRGLQTGFEKMRRRLQRTESSKEFYLSVWKASPYFLISYFAALLTASAYVDLKLQQHLLYFVSIPASIAVTAFLAWWRSRTQDSYIASLRIYCSDVESVIQEKIGQIRGLIWGLRLNLPSAGMPPSDYDFEGKGWMKEPWNLEANIREPGLTDVAYKFPNLVHSLRLLQKSHNDFANSLGAYLSKVAEMLIDADKKARIDRSTQPKNRLMSQALGLYWICSGRIRSTEDIERFPEDLGTIVKSFVRDLLTNQKDFPFHVPLAGNEILKKLATKVESDRTLFSKERSEIETILDYSFVPAGAAGGRAI